MPQYVAKKDTYATGQVTKRHYTLREDHIVEAPGGEFDHLHPTRIRRADQDEEVDFSPPETGIQERGGGWYYVYVNGELKDKKQGKASAEERLQELTLPKDRGETDLTATEPDAEFEMGEGEEFNSDDTENEPESE